MNSQLLSHVLQLKIATMLKFIKAFSVEQREIVFSKPKEIKRELLTDRESTTKVDMIEVDLGVVP